MTSRNSFIIGKLYKTGPWARTTDSATKLPSGSWDGFLDTVCIDPNSIALVIDTVGISWAIALIGDRLVWLIDRECEPI